MASTKADYNLKPVKLWLEVSFTSLADQQLFTKYVRDGTCITINSMENSGHFQGVIPVKSL